MKVYISGEVDKPGVYEFSDTDRIEDIILKAGGATSNANLNQINLAAFLKDGAQIHVPHIEGAPGSGTVFININYATEEALKNLPGIGDTLAASIIIYRETEGPFITIEDIMKVPGIKEKLFENLKHLITT